MHLHKMNLIIAGCALALVALPQGGALAQLQTKDQQKCTDTMNNSSLKVTKEAISSRAIIPRPWPDTQGSPLRSIPHHQA